MKIHSGLESNQVIQRGADGAGVVTAAGSAGADGPVELKVSGDGWEKIDPRAGQISDGSWTARLDGVPAGGPYSVAIRSASGSLQVDNIYVGDLWMLAGQSNMEGVGDLIDVEPPAPGVQLMDLADRWTGAIEPLHWLFESVDSAHWPCEPDLRVSLAREHRTNRTKGAGLGLPFGKAIAESQGVPVGLLACARGGSSMQQWSPALLKEGGGSLYGSMIRRIKKVGSIRGILWYQGESDANPADSREFPARFRELVESVRSDTGQPDLPFLYVQLGRFVAPGAMADLRSWNVIQEAQRKAAMEIPGVAMAAAIDLDLDDAIHIGTPGLKRLGRRLAIIARKKVYGDETVCSGPRLQRIGAAGESGDRVEIEYAGVNGRLRCAGRLSGFSFRDLDGHHVPVIYKQEIDPGDPRRVLLWLSAPLTRSYALHYGWSRDPYCNLVDELDMAAPVFGPLYL